MMLWLLGFLLVVCGGMLRFDVIDYDFSVDECVWGDLCVCECVVSCC